MKKEISQILLALNSSQNFFKYPIGNKELTEKIKALEIAGKINYCEFTSQWKRGKNDRKN
jgi:hypothetical protein